MISPTTAGLPVRTTAKTPPGDCGSGGSRGLELQRCLEKPSRYLLPVSSRCLETHAEGFCGSPRYRRRQERLHRFYGPFPAAEPYAAAAD